MQLALGVRVVASCSANCSRQVEARAGYPIAVARRHERSLIDTEPVTLLIYRDEWIILASQRPGILSSVVPCCPRNQAVAASKGLSSYI